MADLLEIAAAANIAIVDTAPGDGGDVERSGHAGGGSLLGKSKPAESGDSCVYPDVAEYETLFCNRYTESDPDYVKALNDVDVTAQPPCVPDFNVRRQRDGNWNRNRGGSGNFGGGDRYRNRSNHGDWGRQGGGSWGREDRSYNQPRSHGDYHQGDRGYRDRSREDRRDRSSRY